MAEEFKALPDYLRRVAAGVHDVGSEELGVASNARAEVGDGGDAIKPGDAHSFWEQFNSLTQAMEAQGNWLKGLADNLKTVADTVQGSDEA
jgi:uncharacterized protein YukE